jgi:hypothetical protein
MTVRQLLESADSRELQEWSIYLEAEAERVAEAQKTAAMQRELDG